MKRSKKAEILQDKPLDVDGKLGEQDRRLRIEAQAQLDHNDAVRDRLEAELAWARMDAWARSPAGTPYGVTVPVEEENPGA